MANSLTNPGQQVCLWGNDGTAGHGGLGGIATRVKLYYVGAVPPSSSPNKNAPDPDYGMVEVAAGNGYSTGGTVVNLGNWVKSINGGNVHRPRTNCGHRGRVHHRPSGHRDGHCGARLGLVGTPRRCCHALPRRFHYP